MGVPCLRGPNKMVSLILVSIYITPPQKKNKKKKRHAHMMTSLFIQPDSFAVQRRKEKRRNKKTFSGSGEKHNTLGSVSQIVGLTRAPHPQVASVPVNSLGSTSGTSAGSRGWETNSLGENLGFLLPFSPETRWEDLTLLQGSPTPLRSV